MKNFKLQFFLFFIVSFFLIFLNTQNVSAQNDKYCSNRYVTLVNPVRGRDLWIDKTNNPIINQYNIVSKNDLTATWLLQYDTLKDESLVDEIKKFGNKQELGVFLEVSSSFANDSRVIYPLNRPWARPDVIFLSGYTRSERIKLIDKLFSEFKNVYGIYPKSVGAWWIDSYSLNYLKDKYNIKSALIVADQKITDHYGVWGQWWGAPYFPSSKNILIPGKANDIVDVGVVQWAQRHPDIAVGDGHLFSNYSFQANDYIRQGLNTSFFKDLTSIYFDCRNEISQITIGLETGMESVGYLKEYEKQVDYLINYPEVRFVSMSTFADIYRPIFKKLNEYKIYGPKTTWVMTKDSRYNEELGERIDYNNFSYFKDDFVSDENEFLNRRLEDVNRINTNVNYYPVHLIIYLVITGLLLYKNKVKEIIFITLFLVLGYYPFLKSYVVDGLAIYYGPVINNLMFIQIVIVLLVSLIALNKKITSLVYFIALSFGLDYILGVIRYSYLSGVRYVGVMLDPLRFLGVSISQNFNIIFVNKDFPSHVADSFLKFNFEKIWQNNILSLVIYPSIHIIFGLLLYKLLPKLNKYLRWITIVILLIFMLLFMLYIFNLDPRYVIS